ncbi:MAG: hypothetical protein ABSF69_11630 [Polyangiaceae bacterium]|jgi:hypothetical protein
MSNVESAGFGVIVHPPDRQVHTCVGRADEDDVEVEDEGGWGGTTAGSHRQTSVIGGQSVGEPEGPRADRPRRIAIGKARVHAEKHVVT